MQRGVRPTSGVTNRIKESEIRTVLPSDLPEARCHTRFALIVGQQRHER